METATLLDLAPSPGILTGSELLETIVDDTSVSITAQQVAQLAVGASALDAQARVNTLAGQLASPGGAATVGAVLLSGNTTVQGALDVVAPLAIAGATVEYYGAQAIPGFDNAPAFKAMRDAKGVIILRPGATYEIGSQVASTGHNQGVICVCGKATVVLQTGAGKFDRSTYSGTQYDANACGFYSLNFNNYTLHGVAITIEATASVRTIKAAAIRGGRGHISNAEGYGFKECQEGIFSIDSVTECSRLYFSPHDSGTSNATLPSMQITGVCIDDNRLSGVASTNSDVWCVGKNILLTGAALALYGHQTDALNVKSTGENHGLTTHVIFDGVGEGFDCFGSYVVAHVQLKNIYAFATKLIHGAQNCRIDGVVDRTAGPAIVYGGSNTATQSVSSNIVELSVSNIGVITPGGPTVYQKVAVQTDSPSATWIPHDNQTTLILKNNAAMARVGLIESGSNNHVSYSVDGPATVLGVLIASTAGTGNTPRNLNDDSAGYALNRFYGGGFTNITNTTALAVTANTLYAIPFEIRGFFQPNLIGAYVQATGAGLARFGIYRWENGKPGALVIDIGTVSVNAIGNAEVSIASGGGISLADGIYALAMVSNVAFSVYGSAAALTGINLMGVAAPGAGDNQITAAFTYGALPSTFPTPTFAVATCPNLWLRKV